MARAANLAKRIERTFSGPMWHGPALAHVLAGVTPERAAARPIGAAHSIWEIVLHVTAWADIARLRLAGEALDDPPAERDWPPPPLAPERGEAEKAWAEAIERLAASHRELAAAVLPLTDEQLDTRMPGLRYPNEIMIAGVIAHGAYHGGQIALLRKA
jgi:uncharacterized damage-inducible protein DinB